MNGAWNSDRTYHYVPERRRESSQTTFNVSRLERAALDAVLESNGKLSLIRHEPSLHPQLPERYRYG